jgi:outer membrane protein assembly factor BamB
MRAWRFPGARQIALLLALMPGFAFAACGASSPAAQRQDTVYVIGASARGLSLVALGADDGALLWQTPIPQDSESGVVSVTVTPSQVYVLSGGKPSSADWSVMAVRASDGKVAWTFAAGSAVTSIQALGDTVFLASLYGDGVRALRVSDGHLRWQHTGSAAALTLAGNTLYAAFTGVDAGSSQVIALQASDGAERWQQQVSASPWHVLVNQAMLYVLTASEVVALQASDGAQRWRNALAQGSAGVSIGAAASNVYLSQIMPGSMLTALRARDGMPLWQRAWQGALGNAPTITDTTVYATLPPGNICALRPGNGSLAWCSSSSQAMVQAANDQIAYISAANGMLCALQAVDGARRWCQHQQVSSLRWRADRIVLTTPAGAVCTLLASNGKQVWCQHVAPSVFDLSLN